MPHDALDVLVVGGGPGGLHAARRLAEAGYGVALFEEHPEIGRPVHCTGILAPETFTEFGLRDAGLVNTLTHVRFHSPSGIEIEYSTPIEEVAVVERPLFDRSLAGQALDAGADLRCGVRITDVAVEDDGVVVTTRDGDVVRGRVGILACGANYALQRRLGLGFPRSYLQSAQAELPAGRPGDVELYFGTDVAPGGFGWVAPVLRDGSAVARVGVMCARDAIGHFRAILDRVRDRWALGDVCGEPRQKILPLGPIDRTYADRLVAIGDAAGLVKPTTGGGIYYSLVSAELAAQVIGRALAAGDLSAPVLAEYEHRWRERLADEIEAQGRLRALAEQMDDAQIDALFDLARTDGVMPIVRKTARFNQHRSLILALLKHPPVRRILYRTLMG
ncbi:MAG: NAD(P)/FAD-dependent oxidoreductase [Acidobacteriota bacterium]|nr:NAD(P)/FAD-dependent oxidoreductase [Acidobacteriota bacterium]